MELFTVTEKVWATAPYCGCISVYCTTINGKTTAGEHTLFLQICNETKIPY